MMMQPPLSLCGRFIQLGTFLPGGQVFAFISSCGEHAGGLFPTGCLRRGAVHYRAVSREVVESIHIPQH